MLRPEPVKNGAFGVGRISGVVVAVCLIAVWSRPAHSDEPAAAPDEKPYLQLAPINFRPSFGGNLAYVFTHNTFGKSQNSTQTLAVGVYYGARISSFIWQPWVAQVFSNLRVDAYGDRSMSSTNSASGGALNTILFGDANLYILRSTRFPFEGRIFRTDSKYNALFSSYSSESQFSGYSLKQSYMTPTRRTTGDATFRSSKAGDPADPTHSDSLALNLGSQLSQNNTMSISGNTDRQYRTSNDSKYNLDTLTLDHIFTPNKIFSVASFANLLNHDLIQKNISLDNLNMQQFTSYASLRPERTPLTVTGSVRFYNQVEDKNGISLPDMRATNFNLGANYLFSPLIRLFGSVNVYDRNGIQTVSSNMSLAAAKQFRAATNIGGYLYSGTIGGDLSSNSHTNQSGLNDLSTRSMNLGLFLSHDLEKSSGFGSGQLSKKLYQTIGTTVNSSGTPNSRLSTGGQVNWYGTEGKGSTRLGIGASDSRSLNGNSNPFQMINFQGTRSEAIARDQSLDGNLTVQATRSRNYNYGNIVTITPSAQITYRNLRTFKVLHLTFDSILRIADTNIAPTQLPTNPNTATRSWENNFTYSIGRTNLGLNTRVQKYGNTIFSSIYFRLMRQF